MRYPKHPVYCCIECDFAAHISCTVDEVLPSIIKEYEKDAKLKEDLTHDRGLQMIDRRIWDAQDEEKRLVTELEKITPSLDIVKADRAAYISSISPELNSADQSTSAAHRPSD